MTTDIFLRSYAGDIAWVPWALRSIHRFVAGIRDIVIVVPANDYEKFKELKLTREILASSRFAGPELDDYLGQQMDKLYADLHTDADFILYWDSDVVAIRHLCPGDLMVDGRPRCLMTRYSSLVNPDGSPATPWQAITFKAVGRLPEWEYMRQHPMLVPRSALSGFRDFMAVFHKLPVSDYIALQRNRAFSEWNALHFWSHLHAPVHFEFVDTETASVPGAFVKQHWSWGGLTDGIRAEMERLLA